MPLIALLHYQVLFVWERNVGELEDSLLQMWRWCSYNWTNSLVFERYREFRKFLSFSGIGTCRDIDLMSAELSFLHEIEISFKTREVKLLLIAFRFKVTLSTLMQHCKPVSLFRTRLGLMVWQTPSFPNVSFAQDLFSTFAKPFSTSVSVDCWFKFFRIWSHCMFRFNDKSELCWVVVFWWVWFYFTPQHRHLVPPAWL